MFGPRFCYWSLCADLNSLFTRILASNFLKRFITEYNAVSTSEDLLQKPATWDEKSRVGGLQATSLEEVERRLSDFSIPFVKANVEEHGVVVSQVGAGRLKIHICDASKPQGHYCLSQLAP